MTRPGSPTGVPRQCVGRGREFPPEYSQAAKVYRILKSTADRGQPSIHPFTVIEHVLGKGLPLPGPLLAAVRERFNLERKRAGREVDDTLNEPNDAEPKPRSKQFLLRLIYVLANYSRRTPAVAARRSCTGCRGLHRMTRNFPY